MTINNLVFCNLKRRKGRFIFLALGLSVGIATFTLVITVSRAVGQSLQDMLDRYGPNIIITPKSESYSIAYEGINLSSIAMTHSKLTIGDLEKLKDIKNAKNIAITAPKLVRMVELNGYDTRVVGVDFVKELEMKKWWGPLIEADGGREHQYGKHFRRTDDDSLLISKTEDSAIVGYAVAEKLSLKPETILKVHGKEFTVNTILAPTGTEDDQSVFIPLRQAQKIFGVGEELSLVEVSALCKGCPIEDIVTQINSALPNGRASALMSVVSQRLEFLGKFQKFATGIALVALVIGALLVFITVMGSVTERVREIGILRCIGFKQMQISQIIIKETLTVSIAGGIFGYLVGNLASIIVVPRLIGSADASIQISLATLAISLFVAVLVGVLGAFYPSLRAGRLEPLEALRAI